MFLEQIPSFSLNQAPFYWISCGPSSKCIHCNSLCQARPHHLHLSAMLTIATALCLMSIFHIWLCCNFFRTLLQRITSELYPYCCDQIFRHPQSQLKYFWPLPFLFYYIQAQLLFLFSYIQVQLLSAFPPWDHISKETGSLLCSSWSLSLYWNIFSKQTFSIRPVIDKPLVRRLWLS